MLVSKKEAQPVPVMSPKMKFRVSSRSSRGRLILGGTGQQRSRANMLNLDLRREYVISPLHVKYEQSAQPTVNNKRSVVHLHHRAFSPEVSGSRVMSVLE